MCTCYGISALQYPWQRASPITTLSEVPNTAVSGLGSHLDHSSRIAIELDDAGNAGRQLGDSSTRTIVWHTPELLPRSRYFRVRKLSPRHVCTEINKEHSFADIRIVPLFPVNLGATGSRS